MVPYYYTVRRKRRKIKKGRLFFLLAVFLFLILLFSASRFFRSLEELKDNSSWAQGLPVPEKGEPEHVLIYSVAGGERDARVTCICLAAAHPDSNSVRLLLIPVNTLLPDAEDTSTSLAAAYKGGREKLLAAAENLLAVKIHAFLEIEEDAAEEVIKAMDLSLEDVAPAAAAQGISAYLSNGNSSPEEQFEARRQLFASLTGKIMQGNYIKDILNFRRAVPLLTTNYSWREVMALIKRYEKYSYAESAESYVLPGNWDATDEGIYYVADMDSISSSVIWLDSKSVTVPREEVTVEVLNGCGTAGVAGSVAELLRNEGYDVVRVDNADNFDYERSHVVYRDTCIDAAKEIAQIVKNADLLKVMEEGGYYGSDVSITVIIGKNYSTDDGEGSVVD